MSRVRDILHQKVVFHVEETDTVADVASRMSELKVGAILVLRDGELRGVFSERDLMTRVVLGRLDPEVTPVSQVMTRTITTVEDSASLDEAMEKMRAHNCRHLPVLHENKVYGFLSMRDLINFELESKTEELHHMRADIHGSA